MGTRDKSRYIFSVIRCFLFTNRAIQRYLTGIFLVSTMAIYAQVGVHTDFPDASAAMEIYSTSKGLLIPRVVLTSNLSNPSPVTAPATGLMVFNNGPNQPMGFYYWDGSQWQQTGGSGGSTAYWSLTGNAGTTAGTNYIGTTDDEDFLIYTNESERMRFEADGQIDIGITAAYYADDLFTVVGKPGRDYAINAYSPNVGLYSNSTYAGLWSEWARYGVLSRVDTNNGYGLYARNYDANGYGLIASGSGYSPVTLNNHSLGITGAGYDGILGIGRNSQGIGVLGVGNALDTASTLDNGSGGAFTGYENGVYAIAVNYTNGTGVVGVGNNYANFGSHPNGSGGAFTGYHGLYSLSKSSSFGMGIIAAGNNQTPYIFSDGGGGIFTGAYTGVAGFGTNSGSVGGYFVGDDGSYSFADDGGGIGVVGVGNNVGSYYVHPSGSGGAFTGTQVGVYAYATNGNGDRYGAYFQTGGGLYAYVGCRHSNTNRKIVGSGNVSTIVTNTKGERVTLTCPEAPETLFMDFGIGQLTNGMAHIEIDPDLSINILVDEDHPIKIFITPEGECNGVYVTNKSAEGFDVVELMGGKSNVAFSWQIVATRATEEYFTDDGSIEISDYSERFPPAPPPLPLNEIHIQKEPVPEGTRNPEGKRTLMVAQSVEKEITKTPVRQAEEPISKKSGR